jgi:hypothetical protein
VRQAIHQLDQLHQILQLKGAAPSGLALEGVRRCAIREALLDPPQSAPAVHVPKPEFAAISPSAHQSLPPVPIRVKRVGNLEL